MDHAKTIRIHLPPDMLKSARAGAHNFIARLGNAVRGQGWDMALRPNSPGALLRSAGFAGYSLFHMEQPFHPRALNMRMTGFAPFWRIEATNTRWEWRVARAEFDARGIAPDSARQFADRWRKWRFSAPAKRTGHVYIPLQGMLTTQRSFQTASPMDMVAQVLRHDRQRPLIVTTHPNEDYSAADRAALTELAGHPRITLAHGAMDAFLPGCDYVVTQNSSVALAGYFYHKPAVLFAQAEFHHIAGNVADIGAQAAIERAAGARPEFDAYLYWFLQQTAINAGHDSAEASIIAALRASGWPI